MTETPEPKFAQGVIKDVTESPDVTIQKCDADIVRKNLLKAKGSRIQAKPEKTYSEVQGSFVKTKNIKAGHEEQKPNQIESELVRLTHQLNLLNQAKDLEGKENLQQHVVQLESQLSKLTEQRLNYLEQMQKQQTEWQAQFLNTLDKLHSNASRQAYISAPSLHFPTQERVQMQENPRLQPQVHLKEPAQAIPPTTSHNTGTGNLLKEILADTLANSPAQIPKPAMDMSYCNQLDLTPVRDPASAPQQQVPNQQNEEVSDQLKMKELKLLMEREEISKNFPSSLSEYLLPNNLQPNPGIRVLANAQPLQQGVTGDCKDQLKKVSKVRSQLDENLKTVVHRKNDLGLFGDVSLSLPDSPLAGHDHRDRRRIKKLVDEQIKNMQLDDKNQRTVTPKPPSAVRRKTENKTSKPKIPASKETIKGKKSTSGKVVRGKSDQRRFDESESTHTYGKAAYHVRRSTTSQDAVVRDRSSPLKFRMKRAVESVPVNRVRSEKVQTSPRDNRGEYPSFYFDPSPARNVTGREATLGHLIPTAIPMQPPGIFDGDVVPIYIPQSPPRHEEPVIFIPTPVAAVVEKVEKKKISPPVISIQEEHEETFIKEPDVPREKVEDESADHSGVEVSGEAPEERPLSPVDIASLIKKKVKEELRPLHKQRMTEDETKKWLEQEIMAKIISQLYQARDDDAPSGGDEKQDLSFAVDPGVDRLGQNEMRDLIESEILDIIRKTLGQFELHPGVKKQPVIPPEDYSEPQRPLFDLVTPQPSEIGSPCVSIREEVTPHRADVATPNLTSSSISESEESAAPMVQDTEPPPPVEEPLEKTLVYTPPVTPPASEPEVPELAVTRSPTHSEPSEPTARSPSPGIPDPWEGEIPVVDLNPGRPRHKLQPSSVPHEVHDPVVRPSTPEVKVRDLDTSDESETTSSESTTRRDGTISDGQLVISHGELKPKFRSKADMKALEEAATLVGVADFQFEEDPTSEGELRPSRIPRSMPPTNHRDPPRHDPAGIYTRPRHHMPHVTSDEEDFSVGELPPKMSKQRQRFTKWKKSRTPEQKLSTEASRPAPLPVPDLGESTEPESSLSEQLPDDVIMVTSAPPQPRTLDSTLGPEDQTLNFADATDSLIKDSLEGTGGAANNRLNVEEQRKVRLTLPTAQPIEDQSSQQDSDTDDLSVHHL